MKYLLVLSFYLISSLAFGQMLDGQDRGNGGDPCEQRIGQVRDDFQKWISQGGSAMLQLPDKISVAQYNKSMLEQMATAVVSCTTERLSIGTAEKTCVNFTDRTGSARITCNYDRFMSAKDSAQYVLIHHEYAGLAEFEVNKGEKSDYRISDQIAGYFQSEDSSHLDISPVNQCPVDPFLNDAEKMAKAIYNNNLNCVQVLVWKLDLDQVIPLRKIQPIDWGFSKLNSYALPPLSFAAAFGRVEVLQILLNANAYVNVTSPGGYYPLSLAIKGGHIETIKLLVQNGAFIDKVGRPIEVALENLADSSYPRDLIRRMVETLLDLGANPNEPYPDSAPLALAAEEPDLVALLLGYGASPLITDFKGRTPIFYCRTKACVDKFAGLGLDVNQEDHQRNHPIDVVETEEAVKALLSHGSVPRKSLVGRSQK